MTTTDARKIPPEAQKDRRRRAFELKDMGLSVVDIALAVGVHRNTVHTWFGRAKDNTEESRHEAIAGRKRDRRKYEQAKLKPEDRLKLENALVNKKPTDYNIDHSLWHSSSIRALIKLLFNGLEMSKSTLCAMMKEMGFSYQRPKKQAVQADEAKLKKWGTETYPALRKEASERNALIFFSGRDFAQARSQLGSRMGAYRTDADASCEWQSSIRAGGFVDRLQWARPVLFFRFKTRH